MAKKQDNGAKASSEAAVTPGKPANKSNPPAKVAAKAAAKRATPAKKQTKPATYAKARPKASTPAKSAAETRGSVAAKAEAKGPVPAPKSAARQLEPQPQMESMSRKQQAREIYRAYMMISAAAGAVPVPVFDVAALTAVQLKMLHSLARLYEIPFSRELGRSAVVSLVTSLGGTSMARGTFGSLVKMIPVVGSLAGTLTLPALAAAATCAVARTFILHFETGGTLLDFDAEKMREKFLELYREGEEAADQMTAGSA